MTFEQYLEEQFMDQREIGGMPITKDNYESLSDSWFENLDTQELIDYADEYAKTIKEKIEKTIKEEIWGHHELSPEFLKKYSIGTDEEKEINVMMTNAHNNGLEFVLETLNK